MSKYFKLGEHAKLPKFGSEEAACADVFSAEEVVLCSGERHMFSTHVGVQLNKGEELVIKPRSKLANKFGIIVLGGEVDSDYRGEIKVILLNTGDTALTVEIGHAIAQFRVQNVIQTENEWIDNPSSTVRGSEGVNSVDERR